MIAIAINETTKQWIADEFNEGVVPEYGYDENGVYTGEDNYYLVMDDAVNEIVGCEKFWGEIFNESIELITIKK